MEEKIGRVVAVFERLGARWALVGAHAVGALTVPRATADFDFVVEESKLRAILKALEQDFGDLDAVDLGPAMRLRALDVDLIRSTTHALFREALSHARKIEDWRIPGPEVLLVLKFLAAVSPWRERTKRMQDVVDLSTLFLAIGRAELDEELVRSLASQVYPGAESELEDLLGRIERGEPVAI
ncbi:MAG TPA: hypothetical protein VGG06_03190 [Thermoanaerobaculia bacterium]